MQKLRSNLTCVSLAGGRLFFSMLAACVAAAAQSGAPQTSGAQQQAAFLKQNCQTCHNAKLRTGGLALDEVNLNDVQTNGAVLEKVVRRVWTRTMPPPNVPHPSEAAVNSFLTSLEASLDHNAAVHPFAGRPTMLHRLNRNEYMAAVHDLLDIDLTPDDAALLPADDLSYGFDNNGDVLGVPPLLLERYLSVARRASIMAIGTVRGEAPVAVFTKTLDFGAPQDRWNDGLPMGTRGGTAFSYHFPADGEYSIKVKLQRRSGRIIGFAGGGANAAPVDDPPPPRQRLWVGVDGKSVGLVLIGSDQTIQEKIPSPEANLADLPEPPFKTLSRIEQQTRALKADDDLEFRFSTKAGDRSVAAAFLASFVAESSQVRAPYAAGQGGAPKPMGIYSVAITGPFGSKGPGDTVSRERIFSCHPETSSEELPCVTKILGDLAHRAYRRPLRKDEMEPLLTAYERGRRSDNFEAGFELALRRILMDPSFLFRAEQEPMNATQGVPFRISDLELASRLSFFLWGTIPDGELLVTAEKGQLKDPAVLERQVRRMLADPKAHSLVSNFASEWLGLRVVAGVQPDPVLFSDFDGLKQAFQKETTLFLDYVLLGDRSLLELLNANYTFVNERLAVHYGIPNVYGSEFRRVTVNDGIRGGLLGQGGILTATSYPNRTSPVLRGKWILDNILGIPPPPPPPNVKRLDDEENAGTLSMRERMAAHRANPVCAGCHARMDPLGLALEHFDATGKWRAGERLNIGDVALQPIDARGELADGTKFNGIAGLKQVLSQRSDQFVYTMTEQLLTYALGRGVEWYDAPTIRAVVRTAGQNDYRFSSLVLSLVKSGAFQTRMPLTSKELTQQESKREKEIASK